MTTALSTVFAGTSSAASVSQALELNKPINATPNNSSKSDRFWASQKLPINSDVQEVLEINFSTASLTNRISFDAAKFPQTIALEYSRDSGNNWIPVTDSVTQQPVVITILNSYPMVLPSANAINGHSHPQHDYDGHWEHIELFVVPDEMQKIRFVLQRNPAGRAPLDVAGNAVPYSLALQNIYVGYEISSRNDIPRSILETDSQTVEQTIANSTDIFGSNIGFAKKTQFANNLLYNSDSSAPLIWKCEPQPFPRAVVNFYADLRDRQGNAQVIDQIFIDPIYDGPHISLYYSNDSVGGNFISSRKTLNGNQASFNNASVDQAKEVINLGNYGDVSFAQVNNQYISFDPSQSWWLGIEFALSYGQNIDNTNHPIFSCTNLEVGLNSSGVYVVTPNADINSIPFTFTTGDPIQLVVSYSEGNLHLAVQQDGVSSSNTITTTVAIDSKLPDQLYIGTNTTLSNFLNSPISAFVLKQEIGDDSFLNNPVEFSRIPRFESDENLGKFNALLRFDPTLISSVDITGFVGGPAFNYESLNWTPIPREYEMHRGNMDLPPTKAKFWNLEITNLRPEISEKFVPVERSVKVFPSSVLNSFTNPTDDRSSTADLATNVQSSLSNTMAFIDRPLYVGTGTNNSGYTNTEVYVSDDYQTAQRLSSLGNQWKYQQWRPDRTAPRFNSIGQHNYTIQNIKQTTNVSYFAGLRQIQFSRTVNTSPQDHAFIEETFVDGEGVNQGNWSISPIGSLYSGQGNGGSYARTTSIIIPTQRPIRGLQFAAQQSDAKEINTYGEFSDPNFDPTLISSWTSVGDGKILGLIEPSAGTDTALLISRQTNKGFWADIEVNYKTWGGLAVGNGYQSGTDTISFATSTSSVLLSHQGIQQSSIQITSADGTITYVLGTDYTLNNTDGSQPDSSTTVTIVNTGSIPTNTSILVIYNYADVNHPTAVSYGEIEAGPLPPSFSGGIQSTPIALPTGGSIYAAARVTATDALSQPLWIQVLDADTGGVLVEEQSNVGKNEIKEWYTSLDVKNFGGHVGAFWSDLIGQKIYQNFNDNFTRTNSSTLGSMVSGQNWSTPFGGTQLQIVSNTATAGSTGNRSEINTGTPWGILDVTLGNAITTSTHSAAVPVIDLGGMYVMNDSTVEVPYISSTLFTLTTALSSGVRYRFKFMPTNAVPSGQKMSGADPVAQPYSVLVFTLSGSISAPSETWVQTYSSTRGFNTVRALLGAAGQTFTYFNWTPGTAQVNVTNQQLSMPIPQTSVLQDSGLGIYYWDQTSTRRWTYQGVYTYGSNGLAVNQSSLAPNGFTIPGTMAVVDVKDQYGSLDFNVTQLASGLAANAQSIAYLNYNPSTNKIITLQADGSIYDQINATTLKSSMFASATTGPISIRFASAQTFSSSFRTIWGIASNATQAIVILQSNAVVGVYSGTNIWDTTVRGIGGANNGTSAGQYTIIEGFGWNSDASVLNINTANVTWANVSYNDTRTYGQMSNTTPASVKNIAIRLIQKTPTLDYWFAESVALFWEPVIWQFSCDGGLTWWNAGDIRNNPNGVLLFPYQLTNYSNLMWRVTSYSSDVYVSNLTIRPWYNGLYKGIPPRPTQLPVGPNLVPTDHYGPIELDPKWMVWNKPVPRSWWFNFKKNITN